MGQNVEFFWARSQNCEKQLLASSCLSVCLFVSTQKLGASSGRISMKFDTWVFFEHLSRKNPFSLKSYNNSRYFTWRSIHAYNNTTLFFILVINQLDAQNLFYNKFNSCLYMFRSPCAHRQEVKIVLYSIWYHHACRWPSRAQSWRWAHGARNM